jgi:hypothetical protein
MCKITGCQGKVVAQGLCAKHYMRKRRTGDPAKTSKPGRPREQNIHLYFAKDVWAPHASPRTQARCAAAFHNLDQCSAEARVEVLKSCTRPNGSINVSRLLALSLDLWDREHPQEDDE